MVVGMFMTYGILRWNTIPNHLINPLSPDFSCKYIFAGTFYEYVKSGDDMRSDNVGFVFRERDLETRVRQDNADPATYEENRLKNCVEDVREKLLNKKYLSLMCDHKEDQHPLIKQNYRRYKLYKPREPVTNGVSL